MAWCSDAGDGHSAKAGTGLSQPGAPNGLWCADYRGEFLLGNHRYCYPLTITDFATRYLLVCEALSSTQVSFAFTVFERAFKEFGLPGAIGHWRTSTSTSRGTRWPSTPSPPPRR